VTKADPRVNAYRDDLAAVALKGIVDAPRYVEGRRAMVNGGYTPLRNAPRDDAGLDTQLLYGEAFTVYDEKDGWAWGQAQYDNYVGYARSRSLTFEVRPPTHRVWTLGTPLLPKPSVKTPALELLPMNANVSVIGDENGFAQVEDHGFVYAAHLIPIEDSLEDWVGVAERFIGTPYLWGGKTAAGCDCSGLIQTALEAGGRLSPRDTDMMEAALGRELDVPEGLSGLTRGDLVFWKGHVGVMLDEVRLLHANAFHMLVAVEPLADAAERIANNEGEIRSIKRL
jgi:hypothetical protein